MKTAGQRNGFTLVELLVVIAIIGIFVAALMPAVQQSRELARRVECKNHIGRLALSAVEYEMATGAFPSGVLAQTGPVESRESQEALHHSWIVQLLPYLDEPAAAKRIESDLSVYAPEHAPLRELNLRGLICPSARDGEPLPFPGTNYAGVHHDIEAPIDQSNHGILFLNSHVGRADIKDGLQYTLLIGEKTVAKETLGWMSGTRATLRNAGRPLEADALASDTKARQDPLYVGGFASRHPNGVQFVFANGSATTLESGLDAKLFAQLANRGDGELIDSTLVD